MGVSGGAVGRPGGRAVEEADGALGCGVQDAIAEPEAEGAAPGGGEPPRGEAPRSSEAPASRGARHPLLAWALATLRGCDRRLRLAAAALSSVGVLMLLNVLALLLPVSCGRAALWACRLPMVHDLYAAILGCYVLWGGQRIAAALWSAVLQHNLLAAARFVWLWTWVLLEVRPAAPPPPFPRATRHKCG